MDHVSDNFLAHVSPLDLLVEAAGRADEAAVSLYAEVGGKYLKKYKKNIYINTRVCRCSPSTR